LCPDSDDFLCVTIDGDPASKARPRFTRKGHTYTDPKDRTAEERTAWHLRRAFQTPYLGNVAVGCVFFRPNRQRIDVDNMLKHVCDAATGIAWIDDSQVTGIMGIAEFDRERPRTLIVFGRHVTTLTRGEDATVPCEQCGKPVSLIGRSETTRRKFCSKICSSTFRYGSLADLVPCAHCGKQFRRKTSSQKYCGQACAVATRAAPRPLRRADRPCEGCGKQVSKKGYKRCRECWKTARTQGVA
jgi:Holliday junction resolvase RusA-like endonuclease/endogenous inhibitor of DNA gyrase (YacG/DUF329 family)